MHTAVLSYGHWAFRVSLAAALDAPKSQGFYIYCNLGCTKGQAPLPEHGQEQEPGFDTAYSVWYTGSVNHRCTTSLLLGNCGNHTSP
jgi:hypothetical protein